MIAWRAFPAYKRRNGDGRGLKWSSNESLICAWELACCQASRLAISEKMRNSMRDHGHKAHYGWRKTKAQRREKKEIVHELATTQEGPKNEVKNTSETKVTP